MPFISSDNLSVMSNDLEKLFTDVQNEYIQEMTKPLSQMDYQKIATLQERIKDIQAIEDMVNYLKSQDR